MKTTAGQLSGFVPRNRILEVGCDFGLETLRFAAMGPGLGRITGVDKSMVFIHNALQRAAADGYGIDFLVADATALPYEDVSFDGVRAERLRFLCPV